jgi:transcriptional regulator with XRE-family HTH domain
MLSGQALAQALREAMTLKGVRRAEMARHFGVQPPSINGWIGTGRIHKRHLDRLFDYFADVAPPEHWGLRTEAPSEKERENLGDLLATRMQRAISTQALATKTGLAKACGVKLPSVTSWFNGKTNNLRGEHLYAAAHYLGVNPEWLATGRGPMRVSEEQNPYSARGNPPHPRSEPADNASNRRLLARIERQLADERHPSLRAVLEALLDVTHTGKLDPQSADHITWWLQQLARPGPGRQCASDHRPDATEREKEHPG